eukprot:CAMPEP_0119477164 /NCGR_PEP_ID=MMETSP1344-20130328/7416_1 /TAXON_ID=236787 /ORGANISM="Florenciella parvula, Strain CCMP2471" /LENGTH=77 /DNA_ID=CAMNT_0007511111 /DNA_START=845 /DNA_END=1074 /DNA_ORIENTATION=-
MQAKLASGRIAITSHQRQCNARMSRQRRCDFRSLLRSALTHINPHTARRAGNLGICVGSVHAITAFLALLCVCMFKG